MQTSANNRKSVQARRGHGGHGRLVAIARESQAAIQRTRVPASNPEPRPAILAEADDYGRRLYSFSYYAPDPKGKLKAPCMVSASVRLLPAQAVELLAKAKMAHCMKVRGVELKERPVGVASCREELVSLAQFMRIDGMAEAAAMIMGVASLAEAPSL